MVTNGPAFSCENPGAQFLSAIFGILRLFSWFVVRDDAQTHTHTHSHTHTPRASVFPIVRTPAHRMPNVPAKGTSTSRCVSSDTVVPETNL